MCIICVKPKGMVFPKQLLRNCWDSNPDGAGFFYKKDNAIEIVKETFSFRKFYRAVKEIDQNAYEMVFHFRWATHGKINDTNTHPFIIDNHKTVFCHNGVISKVSESKEKSDSIMFGEEILSGLPAGFLHNASTMKLVSDFVGSGKLVFMEIDGTITIVNKEKGEVSSDGAWFSNSGWREARRRYVKQSPGLFDSDYYSDYGYGYGKTFQIGTPPAYSYGKDKAIVLAKPTDTGFYCSKCGKVPVQYVGGWCDKCIDGAITTSEDHKKKVNKCLICAVNVVEDFNGICTECNMTETMDRSY